MIRFDRYEEDRMYLGFTEIEIYEILNLLEVHCPNDEITNRLDALAMSFMKKNKQKKNEK